MYGQARVASPEATLEQTLKQSAYRSTYQTNNQLTNHLQKQSVTQSNYPLANSSISVTEATTLIRTVSPESTQSFSRSGSPPSQPGSQSTFIARAASPIDPLEREQREIDRRRARLEDRRQRVLNAKQRLIGVDVNGLNEQVAIKQSTEQSNLAMERMYDSMRLAHAGQLTQLAYQQSLAQSSERLALSFTHQQQAAEKRAREALNQSINQSTPHVDTPFLNFPGEDLLYTQRMKEQQKQQADWAAKQIEEKLAIKAMNQAEKQQYEEQQAYYLELQRQDDMKRALAIAQTNKELAANNQHMATQKAQEAQRINAIDQSMKHSELVSTFNDRFMVEDSFARDGNRGYCFKGLTQQQRQEILDEQRSQQIELANKRQREQEEKRQYDDLQSSFQRTLILNDIAKRETEARERAVLREERERQAREKAARDQYLNAVVYTNPVKPEYFEQFGTSAR